MKPEWPIPVGSHAPIRTIRDESALRAKARELIRAGKLPTRRPERTWGGPGEGAHCTICSAPVNRDEVEFEIEFTREDNGPGLDRFHVHVPCFAAWELECQNLELADGTILPGKGEEAKIVRHGSDPTHKRGPA